MSDQHKKPSSSLPFNRRTLLQNGITAAAGAYVSLRGAPLFAKGPEDALQKDPHFFLQMFMPGGVDSSYLFDARPLQMTADKLITNYRGKDPILYTGKNGGTCLRTDAVNGLMAHSDYFSVINGILMSTSFDGHGENQSYFLSGQPLGGPIFMDDISSIQKMPVHSIRLGSFLDADGTVTCDGMLKLTDVVGYVLTEAIRRSGGSIFSTAALDRLMRRLEVLPGEKGSRAATKLKMAESLARAPDMQDRVSKLSFPKPSVGNEDPNSGANPGAARPARDDIKTIITMFKGGLTSSGFYIFDQSSIDTHDIQSAKALNGVLTGMMNEIAAVFKHLRETPFDDKRSMLDVTTVVIGSEFSRTMRQSYTKFEESGTNHNPLTNTVLVGGKGFKGGIVLGASDLSTSEDYKNRVSKAHKIKDSRTEHIMGRPFDFVTQTPKMDLPDELNVDQYLNIGSVINTVYDNLGVDKEHWRENARGKPKCPLLTSLRS